MLCPTSALRLQGLYLLLVIYRAFSDAFHSQRLAASGRMPLLVKALLLKCFHLNALNLAPFNLGQSRRLQLSAFNLGAFSLSAFSLGAFNLDTSVAVRQLASYSLARRLPTANYLFVLADCFTLFFIDDRYVTAHS